MQTPQKAHCGRSIQSLHKPHTQQYKALVQFPHIPQSLHIPASGSHNPQSGQIKKSVQSVHIRQNLHISEPQSSHSLQILQTTDFCPQSAQGRSQEQQKKLHKPHSSHILPPNSGNSMQAAHIPQSAHCFTSPIQAEHNLQQKQINSYEHSLHKPQSIHTCR